METAQRQQKKTVIELRNSQVWLWATEWMRSMLTHKQGQASDLSPTFREEQSRMNKTVIFSYVYKQLHTAEWVTDTET